MNRLIFKGIYDDVDFVAIEIWEYIARVTKGQKSIFEGCHRKICTTLMDGGNYELAIIESCYMYALEVVGFSVRCIVSVVWFE